MQQLGDLRFGRPLSKLRLDGDVLNLGLSAGATPITILGSSIIAAWYRADLGVSLQSGAPTQVSAWADQGPNGNNVANSTSAQQPTWVSGKAGIAHLNFSASRILNLSGGAFTLPQPFEVFAVASSNTNTPSPSAYLWDFSPLNTCDGQFNATAAKIGAANGASTVLVAPPTVGSVFVLDAQFNGASSQANIDNGTPTTGNLGSGHPTGGVPLTVGNALAGSFSNGWIGSIYELLILNALVPTAERSTLNAYFQNLYGQP